jgi:hypothetical protein
VFWQNRSFYIGVGSLGTGTLNQQNVVALYNAFGTTPAVSQPQNDATAANGGGTIITGGTGACVSPASFWDIGVRGDPGPGVQGNGNPKLAPVYSVLTNPSENGNGTNNFLGVNPTVVSQYCNGSRVPPELGSMGYQVPPGISDATVPNPIFSLSPAATVDEGNNWINLSWGPLTLTHPLTGGFLGNYALAAGSPGIDAIPSSAPTYALAPGTDFFGNPRPDHTREAIDVGAVEFQGTIPAPTLTSITPNTGARGTAVSVTLVGTNFTGSTTIAVSGTGVTVSGISISSTTQLTATFTIGGTAATTARNVTVTTAGGTSNAVTFTVILPPAPTLTSVTPNSGVRGTSVGVTLMGTNFTATGTTVAAGTGINVNGINVVSSTQINATFTIATNASLGGHSVTVTTTSGGTSNSQTFTVLGPTLTGVSPASGVRGSSNLQLTFTGTNLSQATGLSGLGNGITLVSGSLTVVDSSHVTARINISNSATTGNRNIAVVTSIGTTNTVAFVVQGPTLTSVSPTTGLRGSSNLLLTFTGTNLSQATGLSGLGNGVSLVSGSLTVVDASHVTARVNITTTASTGNRNIAVTTGIGTTNTVPFTVQ